MFTERKKNKIEESPQNRQKIKEKIRPITQRGPTCKFLYLISDLGLRHVSLASRESYVAKFGLKITAKQKASSAERRVGLEGLEKVMIIWMSYARVLSLLLLISWFIIWLLFHFIIIELKLLKIIGYYKFMSGERVSLWVKYLGEKKKKKLSNREGNGTTRRGIVIINPHS